MDYGHVLGRAWQITWRWKFLWVLGLLAGGFQFRANLGYQMRGDEFQRAFGRLHLSRWPLPPGTLIALAVLGVLLGLGFWALSCISRGGLIAGVRQIEEEGATTLGQAWRAGRARFWSIVGIDLLTLLVYLVPTAVACLFFFVLMMVSASAGRRFARPEQLLTLWPALLCALPVFCLLIVAAIALGLIHTWAQQAVVQEGMGAARAFGRGWELLREKLGSSLLLWLLLALIGGVVGLATVVVIGLVLAPGLVLLFARGAAPTTIVLLILGALVAIPTGLWVGSVLNTFTMSSWTLAYRHLVGLEKGAPAAPPESPSPAVIS
jgi:hypothetical protein